MNWQTVGFEKNKSFFEKAVANGSLSHAYLFSGPEMIGKRTFAFELAGLNCGVHELDIIRLDPGSSESGKTISIAEIRRVKNFLVLSPFSSKYKFAIINDAHVLTEEAQNALLKILEEANQSSVLILITSSPEQLLPTVISRCQEIKFSPHQRSAVAAVLNGSRLPAAHQELLVELAAGKIGFAKNILEDNSFDQIKKAIEELSGLAKAGLEEKFTFALKMSDDKNRSVLERMILYWTLYARTRLNEPKVGKILKGLLVLNQVVSQPQYNLRLALENFLLKI